MPYTLIYRDNGFFAKHSGVITIDEINEANGKIHGHVDFDSHKFQVINLLEADLTHLHASLARIPGAIDSAGSRVNSHVKVALIAVDYISIQFCLEYINTARRLKSSWEFLIFSNEKEAILWAVPQNT